MKKLLHLLWQRRIFFLILKSSYFSNKIMKVLFHFFVFEIGNAQTKKTGINARKSANSIQ